MTTTVESTAAKYSLFQNGRHLSILLFTCKLALVASFVKLEIQRNLNEAIRADFPVKKNTKMAAILEQGVHERTF